MADITPGEWGSTFTPKGSKADYPEIDEGNLKFIKLDGGGFVVRHATHHAAKDGASAVTISGDSISFKIRQRKKQKGKKDQKDKTVYCSYFGTIKSATEIIKGYYRITENDGPAEALTAQTSDGDWVPTNPPPQPVDAEA